MILARNNRDHGGAGYAEGCDHQDERSPFHGRSLVSFQNISDCNCQLCISDVIVVTETTILLNFSRKFRERWGFKCCNLRRPGCRAWHGCKTPEEYKAWSHNLGHDHVLTTFSSYGDVSSYRQRLFAPFPRGASRLGSRRSNHFHRLDVRGPRSCVI